jgi:hypothetical protein
MAENVSLPAFPFFDIETDKANAGPHWGKWDLNILFGVKLVF